MRKAIFKLISIMIFLAAAMPTNQPSRSESKSPSIPPMPFPVLGTVKYNGFYLSTNGVVNAQCGTYTYGEAKIEILDYKSYYSLSIPGDDPATVGVKEGCEVGEEIHFTIQSEAAEQSTTWQEVTETFILDISFGSPSLVFLPIIRR